MDATTHQHQHIVTHGDGTTYCVVHTHAHDDAHTRDAGPDAHIYDPAGVYLYSWGSNTIAWT